MKPRRFAKGRRVRGRAPAGTRMNGTEAEYEALFLGNRVHGFEELTFRLGDDCRYTPDFWTMGDDDVLELHEVKGHWEDAAKVKIRVAAERYPNFRFMAFRRLTKKQGGGWEREHFGAEDVT